MKSWEPDQNVVMNDTAEKMKKLKNTVSKIKLILTLASCNKRQDKSTNLNLISQMKNDVNLRPILEKDARFKYMLEQAMPDTKYFINKMFHEVETDFIQKKDYLNIDHDYLKGIKNVLTSKISIEKKNQGEKKDISKGVLTFLDEI